MKKAILFSFALLLQSCGGRTSCPEGMYLIDGGWYGNSCIFIKGSPQHEAFLDKQRSDYQAYRPPRGR